MSNSDRYKRQRKFDDRKNALRRLEAIIEIAILTVVYMIFWNDYYRYQGMIPYNGYGKYIIAFIYAALLLVVFAYFDSLKFGYLKLSDVIISQCMGIIVVNFISYFQLSLLTSFLLNLGPIAVLTLVEFIISFICCYIYSVIYHNFNISRKMIMIYGGSNALTLKFKMETRPDKYSIAKLVSIEEGMETIYSEIAKYDAVVINDVTPQIRNDLLKYCYENEIRTYVVPKISDIILKGAEDITLFDTPLFLVKGNGLVFSQRIVKRFTDIVLSVIALAIFLPFGIVTAVAILIEDGFPVFYTQERVTKDGRIFRIIKFRSMIKNAEAEGIPMAATGHDPRITKVGRVIRACRLDEVPQILNILKGDMSWVGPRPERIEYVEKYCEDIPEFRYRMKVKGGLTGYAQVYGKYDTSPYDKLRLDLMYIENYSFTLDLKIIAMTFRVMFKPEATEGFDAAAELERKKEELFKAEEKAKEDSSSQEQIWDDISEPTDSEERPEKI